MRGREQTSGREATQGSELSAELGLPTSGGPPRAPVSAAGCIQKVVFSCRPDSCVGDRVVLALAKRMGAGKSAPTQSMDFPITKTEEEWRKELSPEEYKVIRGKGTERPRSGEYDKVTPVPNTQPAPETSQLICPALRQFYPKPDEGHFTCRACQNPLYSAASKFNSGCGWPAFDKCYTDSVAIKVDRSLGMQRVEIMCAKCGGHLGHVFQGEHATPTNERHCVNSVSVKFVKGVAPSLPEEAITPKL